jgi:hypothetical protein
MIHLFLIQPQILTNDNFNSYSTNALEAFSLFMESKVTSSIETLPYSPKSETLGKGHKTLGKRFAKCMD